MKHRILEKVNRHGKSYFYPQYRSFFAWAYYSGDCMDDLRYDNMLDSIQYIRSLSKKDTILYAKKNSIVFLEGKEIMEAWKQWSE